MQKQRMDNLISSICTERMKTGKQENLIQFSKIVFLTLWSLFLFFSMLNGMDKEKIENEEKFFFCLYFGLSKESDLLLPQLKSHWLVAVYWNIFPHFENSSTILTVLMCASRDKTVHPGWGAWTSQGQWVLLWNCATAASVNKTCNSANSSYIS